MYELEIAVGVVGFIILSAILWRYGKKREPLIIRKSPKGDAQGARRDEHD